MILLYSGSSRRNRWLLACWTLAYLSTAIVVAIVLQGPPAERPGDSPATEFSSRRAFPHLQAIASKPHPTSSPEIAEVRAYLKRTLAALGVAQSDQTVRGIRNGEAIEAVNVIARVKGSGPPGLKAVLLMAHYDSVPNAPGASDDGLGTATLLETLRALKAGPLPQRDIIALFTDGEEIGRVGSRMFVGQSRGGFGDGHPWMADVGVVFNFEGAGGYGPCYLTDTLDQNGWLIREYAKADPVASGTSLIGAFPKDGNLYTDLLSFREAGVPGFDFIVFQGMEGRHHQPSDTADTLDGRSLQHEGEHALSLARHFGNLDEEVQLSPDAVFFNPAGHWLVTYPGSWALPLAVGASVLYGVVVFRVWRSGRSMVGGLIMGFVAFPIALLLGGVAVPGVIWLLRLFHFESDSPVLRGSTVLLALGVALGIFLAIYAVLARHVAICGLDLGALGWWTILAVVGASVTPGASYLPLWPLIFRLATTTVAMLIYRPLSAVLLMDLGSLPTITLFVPLAYLFLSLRVTSVLGIAVGLVLFALGSMLPLMTRLFAPTPEPSDDLRTCQAEDPARR